MTIPAGRQTATFVIPTLVDALVDPDETLGVVLIEAASSGRTAALFGAQAITTILDPGTLAVGITGQSSVVRESGTAQFRIYLSHAIVTPVEVSWQTEQTDRLGWRQVATAGIDYRSASGTATIPAEDTSVIITVETLDDTLVEFLEPFTVRLTQASQITSSNVSEPVSIVVSQVNGLSKTTTRCQPD